MVNYAPAALIILSVFVSVFVGILMNRRDVSSLKEDINKQFDRMDRRLTLIETDQKQFFTISGKLDGRIDELSRR